MNDMKRLKEQYKDDHPAFGSYLECMTRTLFGGLAYFTLVFSSSYFAQKGLKRYMPHSEKSFILLSTIVSAGAAYYVTSIGTKNCQSGWLSAEEKVTYLTEHVPDKN